MGVRICGLWAAFVLGGVLVQVQAQERETGQTVRPDLVWWPIEVERVVDGDTLQASIQLGLGVWLRRQRIRLLGVDAYELRGRERPRGIQAKRTVERLVQGGRTVFLIVEFPGKRDGFGRVLGRVVIVESGGRVVDVGRELLKQGLARPFRGRR